MHFVELVGVASPDDVVGEVGSALGVRDSVSGRRVLTPDQRTDVRARIAQPLDASPALLILDNCEHVVAAVADLVAFLVATTRDLRVVTTTRAPLAIAAEQVFALAQLDARGVRAVPPARRGGPPGVSSTPRPAPRRRRLDGLPLAIELAAARCGRCRSTTSTGAWTTGSRCCAAATAPPPTGTRPCLRSSTGPGTCSAIPSAGRCAGSRSSTTASRSTAPDACSATTRSRRCSRWSTSRCSPCSTPAATVRYRMLETVREFGRMQLVDAGEDAPPRRRSAGLGAVVRRGTRRDLWSPRQVEAVRAFAVEENNLADALREALAVPDPEAVVAADTALARFWTIRGEHARIFALAGGGRRGARPAGRPPPSMSTSPVAAAVTVINTVIGGSPTPAELRALLERRRRARLDPRVAGLVTVWPPQDAGDPDGYLAAAGADRRGELRPQVAAIARLWSAPPAGELRRPDRAIDAASGRLALVEDADGPWIPAMLHTWPARSTPSSASGAEAAAPRPRGAPVLDRLDAATTATQTRSLLAGARRCVGRLDEAEGLCRDRPTEPASTPASAARRRHGRAEIALARGESPRGCGSTGPPAEELARAPLPGDASDRAGAVGAVRRARPHRRLAVHGPDDEGARLYPRCCQGSRRARPGAPRHGLPGRRAGAARARRLGAAARAMPVEDAVRLLVLADRFGYTAVRADDGPGAHRARTPSGVAPGLAARMREDYGERSGPDLLPEARAASAGRRCTTSCGSRTAPRAARTPRRPRRSRPAPSRPRR